MRGNHGDYTSLSYFDARALEIAGHVKIDDPDIVPKVTSDDEYVFRHAFDDRRMTRVAWVQNVVKTGGAEISNFNCINAGKHFGFDIVCFNPEKPDVSVLNNSDIIIVNNLHCSGREEFLKYLFNTSKPYIVYSHDAIEENVDIFKRSKLNVFISPKHQEHYSKFVGDEISKSITLPIAFVPERWKADNKDRDKNAVLIVNYDKCRNNAIEYIAAHPELRFDVIGGAPIGKNVRLLDKVEYNQIQNVYPKYETVYHCPDIFCAGERVLFEAVLSGCKVITNTNAGHTSWTSFDWRNPDELKTVLSEAKNQFWREVDNVLNTQPPFIVDKKKTVSIVTRCMGRKSFLEKTLPTWLKMPQIEKVIVVDWGAKEDLAALCTDGRVEIVTVPDKKTFEQGETWNVGIRRVKSDYVFMVDIDVLFNADSFAFKKLLDRVVEGQYAENCYLVCAVWPNHLTGTSIFPKAIVDKVNGFVERLPTRGSEEIDLRNRCDKAGAARKFDLWPGMLEHIDHDDAARFENMAEEINILEADKINQRAIAQIDVTKQERTPVKCNILTVAGVQEGVMV